MNIGLNAIAGPVSGSAVLVGAAPVQRWRAISRPHALFGFPAESAILAPEGVRSALHATLGVSRCRMIDSLDWDKTVDITIVAVFMAVCIVPLTVWCLKGFAAKYMSEKDLIEATKAIYAIWVVLVILVIALWVNALFWMPAPSG